MSKVLFINAYYVQFITILKLISDFFPTLFADKSDRRGNVLANKAAKRCKNVYLYIRNAQLTNAIKLVQRKVYLKRCIQTVQPTSLQSLQRCHPIKPWNIVTGLNFIMRASVG